MNNNTERSAKFLAVSVGVLVCALMMLPTASRAAFTRSSLCAIAMSGKPQSIAVDGSDHLWVLERGASKANEEEGPAAIYEFGAASSECGTALGPEPGPTPLAITTSNEAEHLSIESGTSGRFYVSGRGRVFGAGQINVFDPEGHRFAGWTNTGLFKGDNDDGPHTAVDNSTSSVDDPSACGTPPLGIAECFVYVSHGETNPEEPLGDGLVQGVEKLSPTGEAVPFAAAGKVGYVVGNQIVGTPSGSFSQPFPGSVTVDPAGDIYVVSGSTEVSEYLPSGVYVKTFNITAAPGFTELVGAADGVGYDPVSDHLLVSTTSPHQLVEGAVDEFDAASGAFLDEIRTGVTGSSLVDPVDLSTDSHGDLYVADRGSDVVDVFSSGRFLPSVDAQAPSERKRTGARLQGEVDPEGLSLSECAFEVVSEAEFEPAAEDPYEAGQKVPCTPTAASITPDFQEHRVEGEVKGLASGITYRYRLLAKSEGELGGTSASRGLAFTTPHAAVVESESAGHASSSFVNLSALLRPLGAPTSYYFEYADAAQYHPEAEDPYSEGGIVPVAPASIGPGGPAGNAVEEVLQHVGRLTPSTTYHFRVVAQADVEGVTEATDGADAQFTTLAAPVSPPPDDRAYELVTPADKSGGSDMFAQATSNGEYENKDVALAGTGGDAVLLETFSAFGEFPGAGKSTYVFNREAPASGGAAPGKWNTRSLVSPSLGVQTLDATVAEPRGFATVAVNDGVGAAESESGEIVKTLVGPPGGPYAQLNEDPTDHASDGPNFKTTSVVGGSSDLGHVVLQTGNAGDCPGSSGLAHGDILCEWSGTFAQALGGGTESVLTLVNANSEGGLISKCGARIGSADQGGGAHSAISSDGSRVYFNAPDPLAKNQGSGCWNGGIEHSPQIYLRSGGVTTEISAPASGVTDPTCGGGDPCHAATFAGASEDGSVAYFITESWLTSDHPSGHDVELYRYDASSGLLTRVSTGSPEGGAGSGVLTVPAVSSDGNVVFYTAFAALAPGSTGLSRSGNLVNLYRYDAADASTQFIAVVNTFDYVKDASCLGEAAGQEVALCSGSNWYTTPDGRFLVFGTSRELTGYQTSGPCNTLPRAGGNGSGHCEELYRYDATPGAESVSCVSCDPNGAMPVSNASFGRSAMTNVASAPVAAMSDDGSYVFFDTADPLVPRDTNGTLDVYEWHDGHVALLSSGEDRAPSFFLGSSAYVAPGGRRIEGGNVFIGTHARLVPEDTDSNGDLYDVRICDPESPCIKPPPAETGKCEGDACQNAPGPPLLQTPATSTMASSGNVHPAPQKPTTPKPKPPAPSRVRLLAKALRSCRAHDKGKRRQTCERSARRRFGVSAPHKRGSKSSSRSKERRKP